MSKNHYGREIRTPKNTPCYKGEVLGYQIYLYLLNISIFKAVRGKAAIPLPWNKET